MKRCIIRISNILILILNAHFDFINIHFGIIFALIVEYMHTR